MESPLSINAAIASSARWSDLRVFADSVFALRAVPDEGRTAMYRCKTKQLCLAKGDSQECFTEIPFEELPVLPAPYSVGSRINTYGGGAFCAAGASIAFINESDQGIYLLDASSKTVQGPASLIWQEASELPFNTDMGIGGRADANANAPQRFFIGGLNACRPAGAYQNRLAADKSSIGFTAVLEYSLRNEEAKKSNERSQCLVLFTVDQSAGTPINRPANGSADRSMEAVPGNDLVLTARVIHKSEDFYGQADCITPLCDGLTNNAPLLMTYVSWMKPGMPWDSTKLWLSAVENQGSEASVASRCLIDARAKQAIAQPRFDDDGNLIYLSDRSDQTVANAASEQTLLERKENPSDFWRPYLFEDIARYYQQVLRTFDYQYDEAFAEICTTTAKPLDGKNHATTANDVQGSGEHNNSADRYAVISLNDLERLDLTQGEFCAPAWNLGNQHYAIKSAHQIFSINKGGCWRIIARSEEHLIALNEWDDGLDCSFVDLVHYQDQTFAVTLLASPSQPLSPRFIRLAEKQDIEKSSQEKSKGFKNLRNTEHLYNESAKGPKLLKLDLQDRVLSGLWHPALTTEAVGTMVLCHSGPTSCASPAFNPKIVFWLSRGFNVLDLNYRGSTGMGRRIRQELYGHWGEFDSQDALDAGRYLLQQDLVPFNNLIVKGSSAGGLTALNAALANDSPYRACVSAYGVVDLHAMLDDTHRFEAGYTARLVEGIQDIAGNYADYELSDTSMEVYRSRSPLFKLKRRGKSAERVCPILLLHGERDRVVPVAQAREFAGLLTSVGVPHMSLSFENEGHGFRSKVSLTDMYNVEEHFYRKVFSQYTIPQQPEAEDDDSSCTGGTFNESSLAATSTYAIFGDWESAVNG